jgi:hypothetical protein
VPYDGTPGPLNAITDVADVEVGFTTLIRGEPKDPDGTGPVRTGVTAIFPRGKASRNNVFASWFALNGNGEMTGTTWVEESGFLAGPVMITNTHSVGADAVVAWYADQGVLDLDFALPVVAETYDLLNDINGQHVTEQHAFDAMNSASGGPVAEGNVGGGTGMICHWFKGGTGTSSRILRSGYTVHGRRSARRPRDPRSSAVLGPAGGTRRRESARGSAPLRVRRIHTGRRPRLHHHRCRDRRSPPATPAQAGGEAGCTRRRTDGRDGGGTAPATSSSPSQPQTREPAAPNRV